jgi:hypothetical protein
MFCVEVLGDRAPVLEVVGNARHLRSSTPAIVEEQPVALLKHLLSAASSDERISLVRSSQSMFRGGDCDEERGHGG